MCSILSTDEDGFGKDYKYSDYRGCDSIQDPLI